MLRKILEIILLVLFFIGGFLLNRQCSHPQPEVIIKEKIDTLVVVDTTRITEPVIVDRVVRDTMYVEVNDPIVYHDTTYIPLPREWVTYKDSSYTAVVSGYRPRLEEIEIYPRNEVITIQTEKIVTVTKKTRFGVGVQAGYGATPNGFFPYIGVGISYNILSF